MLDDPSPYMNLLDWPPAMGMIAGALITLMATFLVSILNSRIEERKDNKRLKIEKLELLYDLINMEQSNASQAIVLGLSTISKKNEFGKIDTVNYINTSSTHKIETNVHLYLPELQEPCDNFTDVCKEIHKKVRAIEVNADEEFCENRFNEIKSELSLLNKFVVEESKAFKDKARVVSNRLMRRRSWLLVY